MGILDVLYYCFLLRPYSKRITRALRAEPKLYLYDILRIPAEHKAKRLENLAALHLMKMCSFWTDTAQGEFELRYVRTREKRECDFLVLSDGKPWMLVECKSQDERPAPDLLFFASQLRPQYVFQLVDLPKVDRLYAEHNVRVISYERFFSGLI